MIIHIGSNKAASTTLQKWLFSKHPKLNYLGEDCKNYSTYKDNLNSLVSDDDIWFDYKKAHSIFHQKKIYNSKKTFIYSNEDILTSKIPFQCAKRLFNLLPNSKILIIIRNQLISIESWYANHGAYLKNVPKKYWKKHVSFNDWANYCLNFPEDSPLKSFMYFEQLNLYENLFGFDNIRILFFEEFINDKDSFLKKLSNILKIDYTTTQKLLKNKHERPRNKDNNVQLNQYWKDCFTDLYKKDNDNLQNHYSINIKKYDYPL